MLKYRPEIDGLRAVAVVPVILFHAGLAGFSGGYVGVDVFFVISGYLITSLIISEQEISGRFCIVNFYERRARRILPALFLVILCCIPFAWAWMPSQQIEEFHRSILFVLIFASNFFFYSIAGYFDTAVAEKPLLHMWSLAVEEQYYLLFPIFLIVARPFGKKLLAASLIVLALGSLGIAQWASTHHAAFNFYLAPSRLWELLAGSLCALYLFGRESRKNQFAAILGLALIAYSIVSIGRETPYPSIYTVIPVFGTCLLILFGSRETYAGRLLATKPFVGIGLISYSAYLWHQPILAFARIRYGLALPDIIYVSLGCLSFVLAFLSWKYVEKPFRNRRTMPIKPMLATLSVCGITLGAWAFSANATNFQLTRFSAEQRKYIAPTHDYAWVAQKCLRRKTTNPELSVCDISTAKSGPYVMIYGDSHAASLYVALQKAMGERGFRAAIILLDSPRCEYLLGTYQARSAPTDGSRCEQIASDIGSIANSYDAKALILSFRYTFRLYPIPGFISSLDYDNGDGGGILEENTNRSSVVLTKRGNSISASDKAEAVQALVRRISSAFHGEMIVLGPIPESGWWMDMQNEKAVLQTGAVRPDIWTSYARFQQRNRFILEQLPRLSRAERALYIPLEGALCDSTRCAVQVDGEPLYSNNSHLNANGANLVVRHFAQAIFR